MLMKHKIKKHKLFLRGVLYLIVSPVMVPVAAVYDCRDQVKQFYRECWDCIRYKHPNQYPDGYRGDDAS